MTNGTTTGVRDLLASGLGRYEQLLHRGSLTAIQSGLSAWRRERQREIRQRAKQVPRHARTRWLRDVRSRLHDSQDPTRTDTQDLFDYLSLNVERALKELDELKRRNANFRRSLAHVSSQQEHHRLILNYAADMGAKRPQLRGDRRAFRRWFDEEAISDRFVRRLGEAEHQLSFFLERLGTVSAQVLLHAPEGVSPGINSRITSPMSTILPIFTSPPA